MFCVFNDYNFYMVKSLFNLKKASNQSEKYIEKFFIKKNLKILVELSKKKKPSVNQLIVSDPYIPELKDLYLLYNYVLINKRTTRNGTFYQVLLIIISMICGTVDRLLGLEVLLLV